MSLNIIYKGVKAGWITLKLQSKSQSFELNISNVSNPFNDWFYALERIDSLVPQSIVIDTEGIIYRVDFLNEIGSGFIFRVANHTTNEIVFSCHTTKQIIIQEMYVKLMEFARSQKYNPNEYENGEHNLGFSLVNYQNNELDSMTSDTSHITEHTFNSCKYCNQTIVVKTITDMLEKAYEIIDSDIKIVELLSALNLDKTAIGISQEYSRLLKVRHPHRRILDDYRAIQESDSGIYLCFNENFSILEKIQIEPRSITKSDLNVFEDDFKSLSTQEKLNSLDRVFAHYSNNLNGLNEYLEVKYFADYLSNEIVLSMPNQRLNAKKAFMYYPDSKIYPHYEFEMNYDLEESRVDKIYIELCETKEINEPITTWLNQSVITMAAEYGGVYLWFDGAAGDIDSISDYELQHTKLARQLDKWSQKVSSNDITDSVQLQDFNQEGRELFLILRNKIKSDYILNYRPYSSVEYRGLSDEI